MKQLFAALLTTVLAAAGAGSTSAQDAAPAGSLMVPDACYVHKLLKPDRKRLIERIELQFVQIRTKDGTPIGGPRINIGMLPRGSDDVVPSEISAPCVGSGEALACKIVCEDKQGELELGRFRTAPAGAKRLKLTIETRLTLNACTAGETPFEVPAGLVGRSFVLTRGSASDCFH